MLVALGVMDTSLASSINFLVVIVRQIKDADLLITIIVIYQLVVVFWKDNMP